ncbi:centromere protein N-A-like [Glandiceps talaboti]
MDVVLTLRRVLNRFKKENFIDILRTWAFINIDDPDFIATIDFHRSTKTSIVSHITEICREKNIKLHHVAQLDLIYHQKNPNCKKWTVFKLSQAHGENGKQGAIEPDVFEERLRQQLSVFFRHELDVRPHDGSLWFRIHTHGYGLQVNLSDVIYIVHHPHSSYLIASSIKVHMKDYILQSILTSLGCTELKELQLCGHNLKSLADMVLYQQSQGSFSQYRFNQVDDNPLSRKTVKRKADSPPDVLRRRMTYENIQEKKARIAKTEEAFGTNQQPTLERLTYQLETRFRGEQHIPAMTDHHSPVHCTVKFEGKSVLEGIKQLGTCGLATLPLPSHLANVHSLAKNTIVLAEKNKPKDTSNVK